MIYIMITGIGKTENLTGKRFGKLTALKFAKRVGYLVYWQFKCDCGKKVVAFKGSVKSGTQVSCGCNKLEKATKHGLSKTRIYRLWHHMICRCYTSSKSNPHKYHNQKGIKVDKNWHSFENFFLDMNPSYQAHVKKHGEKNTTLDRIDGNKDYSKDNCRWATWSVQAKNRKPRKINNIATRHGDKIKILARQGLQHKEIAKLYNVSRSSITNVVNNKYKH